MRARHADGWILEAHVRHVPNHPTIVRVFSEFMEMPGLRLTAAQAQRLWAIDEDTCRQILEQLVDAAFLERSSDGAYRRKTEGRVECP